MLITRVRNYCYVPILAEHFVCNNKYDILGSVIRVLLSEVLSETFFFFTLSKTSI